MSNYPDFVPLPEHEAVKQELEGQVQNALGLAADNLEKRIASEQQLAALQTAARPTVEGMPFDQTLRWYAARLENVHGDSPNDDFVQLLRDRADDFEAALADPKPEDSE